MDKKFIIGIVVISVLAVVVGVLLPGGDAPQKHILPWQIERTVDGSVRVFGLVLGQSTLQEAEQQLRSVAKINMIAPPDKALVVEAFFEKISPGGLNAQMVLEIDVPPEQLPSLYERGERISTLGSGARIVTLSDQDLMLVRSLPIASITFVPRVRLQPEVILKRFGEPAQRLTETDGHMTHWLYPDIGLDVSMDEKGRSLMQYVSPAQFSRLQKPLM